MWAVCAVCAVCVSVCSLLHSVVLALLVLSRCRLGMADSALQSVSAEPEPEEPTVAPVDPAVQNTIGTTSPHLLLSRRL